MRCLVTIGIVVGMIAMLACGRHHPDFYKAGMPRLLAEGTISTDRCETRCALTPDEKTLFFATMGWREGDSLNQDIYFSHWRNGRWLAPQPVPFNTEWQEFDPAVTPDGLWLYFCSDRPNGMGGSDIWRVAIDKNGFGEPENLGPIINGAGDEWGPSFSADGRVMVFSSDGRGGSGGHDLFRSVRAGEKWAFPANLGPQINSAFHEFDPCVVGLLDKVIFASERPGGPGGVDLWEAQCHHGIWQRAEPLPAPLNSEAWDSCPYLAPSGNVFYFSSTRRTHLPTAADIWMVEAR